MTIVTRSTHDYVAAGSLLTSHGLVETTVAQNTVFTNSQSVVVTGSTFGQDVTADTETSQLVTTSDAAGTAIARRSTSFPLRLAISETGTDTDAIEQTTKIAEGLVVAGTADHATSLLAEGVVSQDTVPFLIDPTTGGVSLGADTGAASASAYGSIGGGACVGRFTVSKGNVLGDEGNTADCGAGSAIAAGVPALLASRP